MYLCARVYLSYCGRSSGDDNDLVLHVVPAQCLEEPLEGVDEGDRRPCEGQHHHACRWHHKVQDAVHEIHRLIPLAVVAQMRRTQLVRRPRRRDKKRGQRERKIEALWEIEFWWQRDVGSWRMWGMHTHVVLGGGAECDECITILAPAATYATVLVSEMTILSSCSNPNLLRSLSSLVSSL